MKTDGILLVLVISLLEKNYKRVGTAETFHSWEKFGALSHK